MIEPDPIGRATGRPSLMAFDSILTRLLYVEDDDDLRDMVGDALTHAGFEVTTASSAEAALQRLRGAGFDVLITDYNLTGETGAWLLASAAAAGLLERTAVIVLTSERHPEGVEGYRALRKPVDLGVLLATIGDALGQIPTAPVASPDPPRAPEIELVLYVTSSSQESQRAIRNLHRALKPFDKDRYSLAIFDVANGGDDEWYRSLEDDRIIVTPTLVKKSPGPKTWIVGTLTPADAVQQMLASVLGEPVQ